MSGLVYFQKHWNTVAEPSNAAVGGADIGLTDSGRRRAVLSADHLRTSVEDIFTSPTQRCIESSQPYVGSTPVSVDARLGPRFYGRFAGVPEDELRAIRSELGFTGDMVHDWPETSGVEPIAAVASRARNVAQEHPGCLHITHGAVLAALLLDVDRGSTATAGMFASLTAGTVLICTSAPWSVASIIDGEELAAKDTIGADSLTSILAARRGTDHYGHY